MNDGSSGFLDLLTKDQAWNLLLRLSKEKKELLEKLEQDPNNEDLLKRLVEIKESIPIVARKV